MVRFILTLLSVFWAYTTFAQKTLNIHTKTAGVVSISFAEKPEVTFNADNKLKVVSEKLSLEYPYQDVDHLSFEDSTDGIGQIVHMGRMSEGISVYSLSGELILQSRPHGNTSRIDWQNLPVGVYIVKDGQHTYKVIKR